MTHPFDHASAAAERPPRNRTRLRPRIWPALDDLTAQTLSSHRDLAIDTARFVAIIAVVGIHTIDRSHFVAGNGPDGGVQDAGQVFDRALRFAVPFFFAVSGYLLARKDIRQSRRILQDILVRIAWPYAVWTALFTVVTPDFWTADWRAWPGLLLRIVLQGGAAPHLWFLPSLAICLALLALGLRLFSVNAMLVLAVVLYGLTLLAGPYAFVLGHPAGVMQTHFVRDAPGFGLVFVVTGFWLGHHRIDVSFRLAVLVFLGGAILHMTEIAKLTPFSAAQIDFVAGTLPFGTGAFLVALSWPWRHRLPPWVAAMGGCSLGLYAVHPAFIPIMAAMFGGETLSGRLAIWVTTLLLSVVAIVEMTRSRGLRRLVR